MATTKTKKKETAPEPTANDAPLSLSDAAKLFARSRWTVRRWIEARLIRAVVLPSGLLGVRPSEVKRFLGSNYKPPNEE